MIDPKIIEQFLTWRDNKIYYPSQLTPSDWIEEVKMSEAYDRLELIKKLFESEDEKPTLDKINALVYDNYKEITED